MVQPKNQKKKKLSDVIKVELRIDIKHYERAILSDDLHTTSYIGIDPLSLAPLIRNPSNFERTLGLGR